VYKLNPAWSGERSRSIELESFAPAPFSREERERLEDKKQPDSNRNRAFGEEEVLLSQG